MVRASCKVELSCPHLDQPMGRRNSATNKTSTSPRVTASPWASKVGKSGLPWLDPLKLYLLCISRDWLGKGHFLRRTKHLCGLLGWAWWEQPLYPQPLLPSPHSPLILPLSLTHVVLPWSSSTWESHSQRDRGSVNFQVAFQTERCDYLYTKKREEHWFNVVISCVSNWMKPGLKLHFSSSLKHNSFSKTFPLISIIKTAVQIQYSLTAYITHVSLCLHFHVASNSYVTLKNVNVTPFSTAIKSLAHVLSVCCILRKVATERDTQHSEQNDTKPMTSASEGDQS